MAMRKIVITGTPCTGKTTLAAEVAKELGVPAVSINDFAVAKGHYAVKPGEQEKTVDIKKTAAELSKYLSTLPGGYVVEGHLACEFALPCDAVVVLRCHPSILARRYRERHYPKRKTDDNLLCELLDYCQTLSELNYPKGKVVQVDNSKNLSANEILERAGKKQSDFINWAELLVSNEFEYLGRI
jgi:broad-specificity NMP kinase